MMALILMAIGTTSCVAHWLAQQSVMPGTQTLLHWCAVIPAIAASAIAFVNRSHRLTPPLMACGVLLLAISLRIRSADTTPSKPGLVLNVSANPGALPDAALSIAVPDATVELAGLSSDWNSTLTSDWWRPNGVTVKKRTWSIATGYVPKFREGYSRRLAIRIHGTETPAHLLAFDFDGDPGACSEHAIITADTNAEEWLLLSKVFGGNQMATTLRLLIGSGDFQAPASHSITGDDPAETTGEFDDIRYSTAIIDQGGKHVIQLECHSTASVKPCELRVRVVDDAGLKRVAARMGRRDFKMDAELSAERTALFEIPAGSKIKELVVERRPAYGIEFREISLLAHQHTTPLAVTVPTLTAPN